MLFDDVVCWCLVLVVLLTVYCFFFLLRLFDVVRCSLLLFVVWCLVWCVVCCSLLFVICGFCLCVVVVVVFVVCLLLVIVLLFVVRCWLFDM